MPSGGFEDRATDGTEQRLGQAREGSVNGVRVMLVDGKVGDELEDGGNVGESGGADTHPNLA